MNSSQELWWRQAKADHDAFELLRREGAAQCHLLHYLQMATEKIAKAYFWRSDIPPALSHAGFRKVLKFLGGVPRDRRERVAKLFSFPRFTDSQEWARAAMPIADALQRLAPDLAGDGPNPEYPWHARPQFAPVNYDFAIWNTLMSTRRGRRFMYVVRAAVERFAEYADT
jgi:hypothetical protein